ncbi:MAG: FkbM family methyltransferase [Croceibacterium sp.]
MLAKSAYFIGRCLRAAAKPLDRFGPYAFLDARQGELGSVGPIDFDAVLNAYLAASDAFFFVQIGAHEGDAGDPLTNLVRRYRLRGIMVEPGAAAFATLQSNYADQPQLIFERAAVAPADGTTTFFSADPEFWRRHNLHAGVESQISSLFPDQIRRHVELFGSAALAARESEYLRSTEVPALTLATLLRKHAVARLDLLQIDTEGFDFEVLKMVDWSKPPRMIQYETVHLSIPDRQAAWALLRTNGYALFASNSYNTLAIHASERAAP